MAMREVQGDRRLFYVIVALSEMRVRARYAWIASARQKIGPALPSFSRHIFGYEFEAVLPIRS